MPKMPKQVEAKRDGHILNTENVDALKTLRIDGSRLQNLATCALGDSLIHKQ